MPPQHVHVMHDQGTHIRPYRRRLCLEKIIEDFGLIVYPRPGAETDKTVQHHNIRYINAPLLDISATYIRKCIRQHKSIQYLLPEKVSQFIYDRKLYV